MADLWYESYAREKSNMYDMKVIPDMYEADVPAEATVIDSTTDFRNKLGPSGDVVDRKTRICARSGHQQAEFDYGEVFTPMAAADTTRVLFAVAAHRDLHFHQVDVKAAYLNASLKPPVYMRALRGDPQLQGIVREVHKVVYGLPESGLRWHELLISELMRYGFTSCPTDSCLLVKCKGDKITYVLVYVDDMLVAGE